MLKHSVRERSAAWVPFVGEGVDFATAPSIRKGGLILRGHGSW